MKKLIPLVVALSLFSVACGPDETQPESTQQPLTRVTASKSTPQDLFRGLFFGRGPVAAKLPQLWGKGKPGAPAAEKAPDNVQLAKTLDAETAALVKAGLDATHEKPLRALADAIRKDTLSAEELAKRASVDEAVAVKHPVSDDQVTALMAAVDKADLKFFPRFAEQIQSGDPLTVSTAIQSAEVAILNAADGVSYRSGETLSVDGLAAGITSCVAIITMKDVDVDTFLVVQYARFIDTFQIRDFIQVIVAATGNVSDGMQHEAWMKIIAADLRA